MIHILASITWDVEPIAINILGRDIAWYGICWATGVGLTSVVVNQIFKKIGHPEAWFDSFFLHVTLSLIIGARLGHCLFYAPEFYLSNPIELLKVWEGGLSSHGGAIGMLLGVCIFAFQVGKAKVNWRLMSKFALSGLIISIVLYIIYQSMVATATIIGLLPILIIGAAIGIAVYLIYATRQPMIMFLDRLIVGVAIGATFIRLGNLMNSEIYGGPTTLPWGFNFVRSKLWHMPLEMGGGGELPAHPTQLYEAAVYFILFLLGLFFVWRTNMIQKRGLILGVFLTGIFGSRFFIEMIKHVQEPFEIEMVQTLGINMGQALSIPFLLWGIWLIVSSLRNKNEVIIK